MGQSVYAVSAQRLYTTPKQVAGVPWGRDSSLCPGVSKGWGFCPARGSGRLQP